MDQIDWAKVAEAVLRNPELAPVWGRVPEPQRFILADIIASAIQTVPDDVRRLVLAARRVAFDDQGPEAIRELDSASEAFADRIPWNDEPPPHQDST